jgi:hypothetical protein
MTNYSEKLLEEIRKKLREFVQIIAKQQEIEADTQLSEDVLLDANADDYEELAGFIETWQCLEDKRNDVQSSLMFALVRANYYPITSVNNEKLCEFFYEVAPAFKDKKTSGKAIKDFLDEINENAQDEMVQRYQRLKLLFLSCDFDYRLKRLYQQVVRCFVMGAFEASCVLCRSIVEMLVKKRIRTLGYELHDGKNKGKEAMSILGIVAKYNIFSEELRGIYRKISSQADRLLHDLDEHSANKNASGNQSKSLEERALDSITLLHEFINRFPKFL